MTILIVFLSSKSYHLYGAEGALGHRDGKMIMVFYLKTKKNKQKSSLLSGKSIKSKVSDSPKGYWHLGREEWPQ